MELEIGNRLKKTHSRGPCGGTIIPNACTKGYDEEDTLFDTLFDILFDILFDTLFDTLFYTLLVSFFFCLLRCG